MKTIALAAATLALAPLSAAAQEWTRFRGPNGTGISEAKNLPVKWTASDYAWRVPIPGESHSQPVIWGDRLFITSGEDEGRTRLMLCLDKKSGKTLWTAKLAMASHKIHKFNSFASGSPTVDEDRVYATFCSPDQLLVKAWTHEGKEVWSVDLGSFDSQHGYGASPMLWEGRLIVPNDQRGKSSIVALNARTGKPVWVSERRNSAQAAYGTPCVVKVGNSLQLLTTSLSYGVAGQDPTTGALLWEAPVFDKRAVASPVVVGNMVLGSCGSGGGGIYMTAIKLGGRGDVAKSHLAWRLDKGAGYVPTPLAVDNRIYLVSDNGLGTCVNARSGEVIWQERLPGGGFFGSPVYADGRIYVNAKEGKTLVLAASDSFELLAENPLGEPCYSTPCPETGRLYMKTFTHLVAVGAK